MAARDVGGADLIKSPPSSLCNTSIRITTDEAAPARCFKGRHRGRMASWDVLPSCCEQSIAAPPACFTPLNSCKRSKLLATANRRSNSGLLNIKHLVIAVIALGIAMTDIVREASPQSQPCDLSKSDVIGIFEIPRLVKATSRSQEDGELSECACWPLTERHQPST